MKTQTLILLLLTCVCILVFESCSKESENIKAAIYSDCNDPGKINFSGDHVYAIEGLYASILELEVGGYTSGDHDKLRVQVPWSAGEGTFNISGSTINVTYDPGNDGQEIYYSLPGGTITISNLSTGGTYGNGVNTVNVTFNDAQVKGNFAGSDTLCLDRGQIIFHK